MKLLFVQEIFERRNYEEKLEKLNKELELKFNQKTEELRNLRKL